MPTTPASAPRAAVAWWYFPLALSSAAALLGLTVLRPWAGPVTDAARSAWVLVLQVSMVVSVVTIWSTPHLNELRRPFPVRAAAVGLTAELLRSVWSNQVAPAIGLHAGTADRAVLLALGVIAGCALVAMVGSLTRRWLRGQGHDVDAIVDATVVSAAGGVVLWELLVVHPGTTRLGLPIAAVSTVAVTAAAAIFVRLLLSTARRLPAAQLLAATLLLAMVIVVWLASYGAVLDPMIDHRWELLLLLAFGTTTAAFLHPSARVLVGERARQAQAAPTHGTVRAAILCIAVVVPALVTLLRAVTAARSATADAWLAMLSIPPALAGVVITLGVSWRLSQLIREREHAHRLLEHRSRHDDLTGLPNRAYLIERLEGEIGRVRMTPGSGNGFGLMFLDLDDFKSINDTYGHPAGDAVLAAVARRLAGTVRGDDFVGRMAGDEFVLLCGDPCDLPSLTLLAERVRDAVEAPMPADFGVVTPRVSIGITAVDGEIADERDAVSLVLRRADAQMYRAKRAARAAADPSPARRAARTSSREGPTQPA